MSAFLAAVRPAVNKLVELARPSGADAVLHLGCGEGMLALGVAASLPRGSVVGADVSAQRVDTAAAHAAALGLKGVRFQQLTSGSLPFKPESFDVVFCSPRAVAQARPLLRRGGRLAVFGLGDPAGTDFLSVPAALLQSTGGLEGLSADTLDLALREAGFSHPLILRLKARLTVPSAAAWWRLAADAAEWEDEGFSCVGQPLEDARVKRAGRLSLELVLARATVDARVASTRPLAPRPLDALVRAAPHLRRLSAAEAKARLSQGTALDVREPEELHAGIIEGSVHLPRGLLEEEASKKLPDRSRPLLVYCGDGRRAGLAALTLLDLGYEDVAILEGGFATWSAVKRV